MAETAAAPLPPPWTFRLFESLPLAPVWVGAVVSLLVLVSYFGVEFALGRMVLVFQEGDAHLAMHYRVTATNALYLGFLPAAQIYLARWTRRHLDALRPLVGSAASEPEPLATRPRRVAGAVGAVSLVLLFLVLPTHFVYLTREYWTLAHVWDWILLPPIGWFTGRLVYAVVSDARRFSRLAESIERIDLLDLSPLAPFVRQGLRSALLVLLFCGISGGFFGVAIVNEVAGVVTWIAMLGVVTVALLSPVRGVRQRIRQEKSLRLAAVRERIRAAERSLLGPAAGSEGSGAELPGLMALEARIVAVREWPFDAPSLVRFAFYVTLGLGSWLGAAAVELLLDRMLT